MRPTQGAGALGHPRSSRCGPTCTAAGRRRGTARGPRAWPLPGCVAGRRRKRRAGPRHAVERARRGARHHPRPTARRRRFTSPPTDSALPHRHEFPPTFTDAGSIISCWTIGASLGFARARSSVGARGTSSRCSDSPWAASSRAATSARGAHCAAARDDPLDPLLRHCRAAQPAPQLRGSGRRNVGTRAGRAGRGSRRWWRSRRSAASHRVRSVPVEAVATPRDRKRAAALQRVHVGGCAVGGTWATGIHRPRRRLLRQRTR
jgi:hypothetical protein